MLTFSVNIFMRFSYCHLIDSYLQKLFPNYVKTTAWKLFYSNVGQHISIGNYWRDPHHIPMFLSKSTFLAKVDNCVGSPNTTEFKNNFVKLKKLVLIGGKSH